jgi:hypothetical protein
MTQNPRGHIVVAVQARLENTSQVHKQNLIVCLVLIPEPPVHPDDEQQLRHGDEKEDGSNSRRADAPPVPGALLPLAAPSPAGSHPAVPTHGFEEPAAQGVRVGVGPDCGVHLRRSLMRDIVIVVGVAIVHRRHIR